MSSILKTAHQTELQTNQQHYIETKTRGLQQQIRLRKATESDGRESVCCTWVGHRFFKLIFDTYILIGNESIYKRIKVLIKFVCKLPFTFYFYSLIQFFNFRTKIPLLPRKTAIAQTSPPPPPPPQRPLAALRDENGNGRCP